MGPRFGFSVQPRSRSRRRTKCFVTMPACARVFLCTLVMLTSTMSVCNGIRDYGSRVDSFGSGSSEELHHDTLFHTIGLDHPDHLPPQGVCEPIKIGLCMEVGYNQTTMPNLVGHDAQADAEALLQTFTPLIQYGCSAHLKLFLCSAYVPMCTEKVPEPIGPCRSLCESVRRSCEPILTEFGFSWPPSLNCSKFHPENNHQHMCIPGPTEQDHYVLTPGRNGVGGSAAGSGVVGEHNSVHHVPSFTTSPGSSNRDYVPKLPGSRDPSILHRRPIPTINNGGSVHHSPDLELQFPFSQHHFTNEKVNSILKQHTLSNAPPQVPGINTAAKDAHAKSASHGQCTGPRKVWSKGTCWIRCPADVSEYGMMGMNMNEGGNANSVPVPASSMSSPPRFSEVVQGQQGTATGVVSLFEPSERVFARNYILLWASLSLSAALIALTLSVCSPKLSTAERPILYIALCQVLFSIGIIIGSTLPVACFFDRASEQELLAGGEMVPSSCAVVFLLTYFFGTAATLWWVILCLSWLLSVNRRLALSLEQKEWSAFHLASWGLASLLTSAALIHKKVDVDELTGLCGVGFQNTDALTYYNMIPLNVCLASGFLFLLIGIVLRHFTSARNNPYLFSFGLARLKSGHAPNCEFGHGRQGGHSLRAPQGYSPVLVAPPSSNNNHSHSHSHGGGCTSSHGHCACSGGSSSGGGSPSSANSVLQIQRIKALQNSKAVWMRVGIFALVHSLPVACQVGTLAYELSGREAWENGKERPNVQIFLLRLNMNLIAGLTTGVWVLSTYSWKSLSSLSTRLCSCRCFKFFSQSKKSKSVPLGGVGLGLGGGGGSCPTTSSVLTTGNSNSNSHNHNPSTTPLIPIPQLPPPSLPPFHGNGNTILSTFQSQPPMSNGGSGSGSHSHAHSHSHHLGGQHQHQHQYQQHGGLPHRSKFSAGGGIVPRHHHHINHPLPPIPPARNNPVSVTESHQQPPQRTDAWRRGETIL